MTKTEKELMAAIQTLVNFVDGVCAMEGAPGATLTVTCVASSGKEYEVILRETKDGPFQ